MTHLKRFQRKEELRAEKSAWEVRGISEINHFPKGLLPIPLTIASVHYSSPSSDAGLILLLVFS